MDKTPRQIAAELFRENPNASLYEIQFCTEAETQTATSDFVTTVVQEYERLQSTSQQPPLLLAANAEDALWSRPKSLNRK